MPTEQNSSAYHCQGCGAAFYKDQLCYCYGVGEGKSLNRETHALAHRTPDECRATFPRVAS